MLKVMVAPLVNDSFMNELQVAEEQLNDAAADTERLINNESFFTPALHSVVVDGASSATKASNALSARSASILADLRDSLPSTAQKDYDRSLGQIRHLGSAAEMLTFGQALGFSDETTKRLVAHTLFSHLPRDLLASGRPTPRDHFVDEALRLGRVTNPDHQSTIKRLLLGQRIFAAIQSVDAGRGSFSESQTERASGRLFGSDSANPLSGYSKQIAKAPYMATGAKYWALMGIAHAMTLGRHNIEPYLATIPPEQAETFRTAAEEINETNRLAGGRYRRFKQLWNESNNYLSQHPEEQIPAITGTDILTIISKVENPTTRAALARMDPQIIVRANDDIATMQKAIPGISDRQIYATFFIESRWTGNKDDADRAQVVGLLLGGNSPTRAAPRKNIQQNLGA